MVRKKHSPKKKSHRVLKTIILLGIFIGISIHLFHSSFAIRIRESLLPQRTVQTTITVSEPQHVPPKADPVDTLPSAKAVTYTIRCPQYDNLTYGVPGAADTIIEREGYALGYIEKHEQAAWVVYRLTRSEVLAKAVKRTNRFAEDPEIPTGSATAADYRRSGYDRGHLAPAADMAFSVQTMKDSFYYSNMSPQRPQFNRGIWKDLEEQIRQFAIEEGEIYVVTGPVLSDEKNITIGPNKVTVPSHFYKVVFDLTPPQKMIGFILPNQGNKADLRTFAVTVDKVEELTGLDFFSTIPQPHQEQLERTITVENWHWIK